MKVRKESINLFKANIVSFVILVVAAVIFGGFFFLLNDSFSNPMVEASEKSPWAGILLPFVFLVILLVGIVAHELIHGITFAIFAPRGYHSVSYGVLWKSLTPYAHCDDPLRKSHYICALLMPFLILGVAPAVVSLFNGSFFWLIFGVLFIAAAAGDLMMTWMIWKENPEFMVLDHPSEAGYFIFEPEEGDDMEHVDYNALVKDLL